MSIYQFIRCSDYTPVSTMPCINKETANKIAQTYANSIKCAVYVREIIEVNVDKKGNPIAIQPK